MTKSNPNFTKIGTGYPGTLPKVIPKNHSKMTRGSTGISDLVKRIKLGQEKPKPSIDLLVAIQQDCDVSRHNLHVLASPKQQESRGNNKGNKKSPKALEITQIQSKEGGEEGVQIMDEICQTKSIYYSKRSDYKSHNSAYHPIILPTKWILD